MSPVVPQAVGPPVMVAFSQSRGVVENRQALSGRTALVAPVLRD